VCNAHEYEIIGSSEFEIDFSSLLIEGHYNKAGGYCCPHWGNSCGYHTDYGNPHGIYIVYRYWSADIGRSDTDIAELDRYEEILRTSMWGFRRDVVDVEILRYPEWVTKLQSDEPFCVFSGGPGNRVLTRRESDEITGFLTDLANIIQTIFRRKGT
jgi:hypothetical protein